MYIYGCPHRAKYIMQMSGRYPSALTMPLPLCALHTFHFFLAKHLNLSKFFPFTQRPFNAGNRNRNCCRHFQRKLGRGGMITQREERKYARVVEKLMISS